MKDLVFHATGETLIPASVTPTTAITAPVRGAWFGVERYIPRLDAAALDFEAAEVLTPDVWHVAEVYCFDCCATLQAPKAGKFDVAFRVKRLPAMSFHAELLMMIDDVEIRRANLRSELRPSAAWQMVHVGSVDLQAPREIRVSMRAVEHTLLKRGLCVSHIATCAPLELGASICQTAAGFMLRRDARLNPVLAGWSIVLSFFQLVPSSSSLSTMTPQVHAHMYLVHAHAHRHVHVHVSFQLVPSSSPLPTIYDSSGLWMVRWDREGPGQRPITLIEGYYELLGGAYQVMVAHPSCTSPLACLHAHLTLTCLPARSHAHLLPPPSRWSTDGGHTAGHHTMGGRHRADVCVLRRHQYILTANSPAGP